MTIYTDGSKMERGTGTKICCEELEFEVSIPLDISATVFQSEVLAFGKSCAILTERKRIVTCSDRESVIKALSSCKVC